MGQALSDTPIGSARFRRGIETSDIEAVLETLAHDVVLHSPFTHRISFTGIDEIRSLLPHVFSSIQDITYFADIGDAETRALFYRANVKGEALEEATRLHLNGEGLIDEITLFFRPLPGLATLMAVMAPRIAMKRGRLRAITARLLLAPLGFATRFGDRLVKKFV